MPNPDRYTDKGTASSSTGGADGCVLNMQDVINSQGSEVSFVKNHGIDTILNEKKMDESYINTNIENALTNLKTLSKNTEEMSTDILDKLSKTNSDVFALSDEAQNHLQEISNINDYPVLIQNSLNGIKDYLSDIQKFNEQLRKLKIVAYYEQLAKKARMLNDKAANYPKYEDSAWYYTYPPPPGYPQYPHIYSDKNSLKYTYKKELIDHSYGDKNAYSIKTTYYQPYIDFAAWSINYNNSGCVESMIKTCINNLKSALELAGVDIPAAPEDID